MKYIKQIDGLRFIAVSFVIISHFAPEINIFSAGYYGVDLFFVISGFLITGILLKSNASFTEAYRKFIGRRTLRIFPLYYLTILILFIFKNPYVQKYIVYLLTYTYNYIWPELTKTPISIGSGNMGHFWSLCVEEQFYLFWPFIILGLRKYPTVLKWVILTVIIICSVQYYFSVVAAWVPYNYTGLIPRASSLSIGGLGAILLSENKIPLKILETKWIEYTAIFILFYFLYTAQKLQFTICPVISLFLILKTAYTGFLIAPLNNFLKNKKVTYLGSISYGIYLFHIPVGYYFGRHVFDPFWNNIDFASFGKLKKIQWQSWIVKLPLYSGLSIIAAHFSYKYFERPFLLLKDKYFK